MTEAERLLDGLAVVVVLERLQATRRTRDAKTALPARLGDAGERLLAGEVDGERLGSGLGGLLLFVLVHPFHLVLGSGRNDDDVESVGGDGLALFVDDGNLLEVHGLRSHEALFAVLVGEVLEILLDLLDGHESHVVIPL